MRAQQGASRCHQSRDVWQGRRGIDPGDNAVSSMQNVCETLVSAQYNKVATQGGLLLAAVSAPAVAFNLLLLLLDAAAPAAAAAASGAAYMDGCPVVAVLMICNKAAGQ